MVWWIFSRLWAPLMAIGWPALAIYGALLPRSPDLAALRLEAGDVAVLIGVGTGGKRCVGGEPCEVTPPQRSYVVVPKVFSSPSVFVVEDTEPVTRVTELAWQALVAFSIWILCVFGTWYYWVRPAWHLTSSWSEP
jgi:hypothetical protein